ncbi:uncharacterized protein LOC121864512 isoform X3 [Homarus americanus]|uniref:uncharacterized protein LOC121864512 isoform X3 n=1 Tax=Homarus americanus TaxID=6706 RepID=UPI001C47591A|nr:uncharacterized protein LOC121864512 isoform X3 [Homarus americanus]
MWLSLRVLRAPSPPTAPPPKAPSPPPVILAVLKAQITLKTDSAYRNPSALLSTAKTTLTNLAAGKAVTLDTSPAAEPSYTSRRGGWGGPRLHHSSYLRRRHQMPSSTLPISTLILDKILRFLCHYLYSDVYFAGNSTLGLLL